MKEIKTHPVNSSNIKEVGYDATTSTLRVIFYASRGKSDNTYDYNPITQEAYIAMITADSIGNYFHTHIRTNKLVNFTKIK